MATAGPFAGRISEVASSADNVTYTDVERVNNPRLSGTNDTAETSSNDSSGHKEFIYTWQSGQLTFEMVADEVATGQEAVWTSFLTRSIRYWRVRPRGDNSGDKQIIFQGLVTSIEQNMDKADKSTYNVTVQRTGAPTRSNQ